MAVKTAKRLMTSKAALILLSALIAFSLLSVLTTSVKASSGVACQTTASANNSGVSELATYTVSVKSIGTAPLGALNISLPGGLTGYKNVQDLVVTTGNWTGTINGNNILIYSSVEGLTTGPETVSFTFEANNPIISGNYKWSIGANENASVSGLNGPFDFNDSVTYSVVITSIVAASLIFLIAAIIAFANTAVNRVLINYFVGWEQYRVMQKEMNEYRQETMAAARANDKKQIEKLKKRQSQINSMQSKMIKPQMVQLGISFIYLIVWFLVLTPYFGARSLVYLPGIGAIPVVYWYPICSFFLGVLGSRILGIMPIEP